MVFKRYIKRDGKVFGPYLYESKRVNGKVVSKYKGSAKVKSLEKIKKVKKVKEIKNIKTKSVKEIKPRNKSCKEIDKGNKIVACKDVAEGKARNANVFDVNEFIDSKKGIEKRDVVEGVNKKKEEKKKIRRKKSTYIAKPMISVRELMDEFNRRLLEVGKTITFGEFETSLEHYTEMVKIYNKIKNKLPYEDSIKLFNAIKRVYDDLEELRATESL